MLKDRPEQKPRFFRKAGFASQSANVPVCFPGFQLPGVHHLLPFGQQEMQTELMLSRP